MSRLSKTLTIAAVLALGVTGLTRAEVWVELDGSGHVVATHVPSFRNASRVWRTSGAAPSRALVLNPDGATRGDGRPDIAIDPVSGLPRAVWAMRGGSGFDIVTSTFDGRAWTEAIPLTATFGVDELDPRIAFRANGTATVAWWTNASVPTVQLAIKPSTGMWQLIGTVSEPGVKAKMPAISLEGNLIILAYRTSLGTEILKKTIVEDQFGDGPTPFPRDNGNNGPETGNDPPSRPPDNP